MNKKLALVIGLLVLGGVSQSRGDGFIIVERPIYVPPTHFPFAPLEVTSHQVNVKIDGQVAITSIDQEFYNPNDQRLEGFYMFPVPKGAHIDKFSMEIGGKTVDAELLPADKARGIYEDIVRKMRDPALLEYAGRDLFKVRIFPIEPRSRKPIKISYTELLRSDAGTVTYLYPLSKSLDRATLTAGVSYLLQNPLYGFYVVAENATDSEVVGSLMITYEWSDWRNALFWWVQSVYVKPLYRRRGVYRALYAGVKDRAASERGVCGFRLYVEKENTIAQQTYRKLGMDESHYLMFEEGCDFAEQRV